MVQKLVILSGLFMSATCMVLHQAPLVYLPIQYQEPTPNYNYAYEVNDAHTGDFKRLHETRIGGAVQGQYSLLQPDGVTRTVDYRADDINGFNAVVSNAGRPNVQAEREEENDNDAAAKRSEERQSQPEQSWQTSNDQQQQATPSPSTISHTSLIHHILRNF